MSSQSLVRFPYALYDLRVMGLSDSGVLILGLAILSGVASVLYLQERGTPLISWVVRGASRSLMRMAVLPIML